MDTTQPNLAPRCNHIHDNGRQCGSPALRSRDFCYYHQRMHHPMPHPRKNPAAFIPPLESADAISIAVTNIARAVGTGILDERQARTMIAAIRQIRWAFDYASNRGSSVTDVPEAMSQVLTLAHTDIEPAAMEETGTEKPATEEPATEKSATDIPVAERPEAASCQLPLKPTKGFCPLRSSTTHPTPRSTPTSLPTVASSSTTALCTQSTTMRSAALPLILPPEPPRDGGFSLPFTAYPLHFAQSDASRTARRKLCGD